MVSGTNGLKITYESELTEVLSNYNQDFIYSTVTESLNNRLRCYDIPIPNLIASLEEQFKLNQEEYNNLPQFAEVRQSVYEQVIILICDFYNFIFDDTMNPVSDAHISSLYMYEFFISSFQKNITTFFINYIMKEKVNLFDTLELINRKKNKDTSTNYAKKNIKNPKLAIISANLDYIIDNICTTFDITFERYISLVYGNNTAITKHLLSVLTPQVDFFKTFIVPLFNPNAPFRSILLTDIRLTIQQMITLEDTANISQYIKEEK